MSNSFGFTIYTFPPKLADLGFEIAVPSDWTIHDLPMEDIDFSNPVAFAPLMVATSPVAAVALTVAARPAYDNGSVRDWVTYLLENNEIQMTAGGPREIGPTEGIMALGRQNQEGTWLDHRFFLFEDGGRLVNVNLMAPESLAGAFEPVWQAVMEYFKLSAPKGQTVPVSYVPPSPHGEGPAPSFALYALADDASSMDPEHQVNANLRNKGAGLTPNVAAENTEEKKVTIGAGSIEAQVDIPMGWFAMDDGKRTLVFEPAGEVQINLSLIPCEGRNAQQLLDALQAEAQQSYPAPQFLRLSEDEMHGLSIRNIFDGDAAIEQLHLITAWRDHTAFLRARVTATPPRMRDAANLAQLILKSAAFDAPQLREPAPAPQPDEPAWWTKAKALELENHLAEAEKVIADSVPHIAYAICTADLYRLRMIRLRQQHDSQGAHQAWEEAADWARTYAGMATSGGEGAALSLARDRFIKELGPDPGGRD
ncbi:hypothetical protein [Paludibaculum fermentans]|uniref:Uncharacterized protein n=1 Tax=Paludibaculum fermentans TaxID=1473598 RepID=A0A7S7SPQ8_PALFE|nr:hypothetical protein [Paludibaculum fermentans]QOY91851.1 hypothetical protein IRI77_18485 [Paludibaculum fermentans]